MTSTNPADDPNFTTVLSELVDGIVDSCLMDGILDMHRAIKLGYFNVIAPDPSVDSNLEVQAVGNSTRDAATKAASCCRCVKCHCKVAATRFAPHLSNCMGLGRNSSRRANKRIAEQQRLEDFDDDYDVEENTTMNLLLSGPNVAATPSTSNSNSASNGLDTTNTRCPEASAPQLAAINSANTSNNKQHSPLKMTISLVPVVGKSEGRQHVARPVGEQLLVPRLLNSTSGATAPDASLPFCPSVSSRARNHHVNNSASKLVSAKTPFVLPLVHHHSVRSDQIHP